MRKFLRSKTIAVILCIAMAVPVYGAADETLYTDESYCSPVNELSEEESVYDEILMDDTARDKTGYDDGSYDGITMEETASEDMIFDDAEPDDPEDIFAETVQEDEYADYDEGTDQVFNPEYVSDEDIERFKADGTWDEKCEMMEELAMEQEELQQSLIGNLAMYDPEYSDGYGPEGAPIGYRQPVTGVSHTMPATGNVKPIVFTAEFRDMRLASSYKSGLRNRLFGNVSFKRYPYTSFSTYYYNSSFGKLNLKNGEIHNYISPNARSYYNSSDKRTKNRGLYKEIFSDWTITLLDGIGVGEDQDEYLAQKLKEYDSDGDMVIDAIYIIYAGPHDGWGSQWWSYRTNFSYRFGNTGYSCKQLVFMNSHGSLEQTESTIIHETGHMLGLADYYGYDKPKQFKLKTFDTMHTNSGDNNGFSKMLLGWLPKERVHIIRQNTRQTLKPYGSKNGDIALIIPDSEYRRYGIYSEFIMAEYYQQVGNDRVPSDYKANPGIRLFHVYARLNDQGNNFIASNNYNKKIPLISSMDRDFSKHKKGDAYSKCFYYKGSEFGPWTAPGSSFYHNPSNDGIYSTSPLKYTGIYINNINLYSDKATFDARFLSKQTVNSKFRKKAAVRATGHMGKEIQNGYRLFTLELNQDVSVVPGKTIELYNGLTNRRLATINSSAFKIIHSVGWSYTRSKAYLWLSDKYVSGRYLKIKIPQGTFRTPGNWINTTCWSNFNYSGRKPPVKRRKIRTGKRSTVLNISDHMSAFDAAQSWDASLDDGGNGIVTILSGDNENYPELYIYNVSDGEFDEGETVLRPSYKGMYAYDAYIVNTVALGDGSYLVVAGDLYSENEDDEKVYYDLITVKDGKITGERVVGVEDISCVGVTDGKLAVAVSVNGTPSKQTLTMYAPASGADVTYNINAGISNEYMFTGGGEGTIKKVGDKIAMAPDGASWIVLKPAAGTDITGYWDLTQDGEQCSAIGFKDGKYYAVTLSDDNVDDIEALSDNEIGIEIDIDDDDDDEPYIYDGDNEYDGSRLEVYSSLEGGDPVYSVAVPCYADEIVVSDAGVLTYGRDDQGCVYDIDLSTAEQIDDIEIHNAFATDDGGFFVVSDTYEEEIYEEEEDAYYQSEEDDGADEDGILIDVIYPPYDTEIITEAPKITTTEPDRGTAGLPYYTVIEADGSIPMEWTISKNALPKGLSLDEESGEITGIPEKDGQVKVTLCATNPAGYDTKELTFVIEKEPTYVTLKGIPRYVEYTGSAITFPSFTVDYKGRTLKAGTDYSVKYLNNTNCGEATVQVTLKNGLGGIVKQKFTIYEADIETEEFEAEDICVKFKKNSKFKPAPVLKWNGKKLKAGRDYSITGGETRTAVGDYTVSLNGINNFTGTREITFSVTNNILMKDVKVKKIAPKAYTGDEIRPASEIVVTYKGKKVPKAAYSVSYEDNIYPGKARIIIEGTGKSVEGLAFSGVKKAEFVINGKPLGRELKSLKIPAFEYNGEAIEPVDAKLLESLGIGLREDIDYTVEYLKNDKAGRATAVFYGAGEYTGTVKKSFTINRFKLYDGNRKVLVSTDSVPYVKGGAKCEPLVTADGRKLEEGTDYTLSFSSNNKAGVKGCVTVRGKGNYSGSCKAYFDIEKGSLWDTDCYAEDVQYKAGKKAAAYLAKPVLKDVNGKKLSAGSDYSKQYSYVYDADTKLADGRTVSEGNAVKPDDMIAAGTPIRVVVKASGTNYMDDTFAVYRVVNNLIKNGKYSISKSFYYNGEPIEPQITDIVTTAPKGSYEIIGYEKNTRPGTGTVILHGIGSYGGSKKVKFKILKRNIKNSNRMY